MSGTSVGLVHRAEEAVCAHGNASRRWWHTVIKGKMTMAIDVGIKDFNPGDANVVVAAINEAMRQLRSEVTRLTNSQSRHAVDQATASVAEAISQAERELKEFEELRICLEMHKAEWLARENPEL